MSKLYLGVDIGGTSIKFGLVSLEGLIVNSGSFLVNYNLSQEEIIDQMVAEIIRFLEINNVDKKEVYGIGIGCPGSIDSVNGVCDYSNNLKWNNLPIKNIVEKRCGILCKITNDANAAALGEVKFGVGKNYKDAIMLTLGTGVGGGIVINGKLYEGNFGKGAELGHSILKINGRKCTCGRKGCVETYASTSALIKDSIKEMRKNKKSSLWKKVDYDVRKLNGKILFEEIKNGDSTANKVFDKYCEYLKEAILDYCNIFRPELIILGGGISSQEKLLMSRIIPLLEKEHYGFGGVRVEVKCAKLGNDAGIIGAASLVM